MRWKTGRLGTMADRLLWDGGADTQIDTLLARRDGWRCRCRDGGFVTARGLEGT